MIIANVRKTAIIANAEKTAITAYVRIVPKLLKSDLTCPPGDQRAQFKLLQNIHL